MKQAIRITFLMLFCTILMQSLVSCESSPTDKAVALIEKAIVDVNKANDLNELIGIANTLKADADAIEAAHPNFKPTEEEAKLLQDKLIEFQRAYAKRTMELTYGDSEYGEQAQKMIDKMLPRN